LTCRGSANHYSHEKQDETTFIILKSYVANTKLQQAARKLSPCPDPNHSRTYASRKMESVARTAHLLSVVGKNGKGQGVEDGKERGTLEAFKKADDVADAFLHALVAGAHLYRHQNYSGKKMVKILGVDVGIRNVGFAMITIGHA
jgi:hypothetical protein